MNQSLTLNTLSTIFSPEIKSACFDDQLYEKLVKTIGLTDPENVLDKQEQVKRLITELNHSIFTPYLDKKYIIGFGGGFSAGKSRFLNTLLKIESLPEALEPCTAVPTYIGYNEVSCFIAKNLFQQNLSLSQDQVQGLSHLFDSTSIDKPIQLGQLLEHIYLGLDDFKWRELAFLDTPGYSKADSQHNDQTDEKIALEQLKKVDHLVWLLSAKNGTIREDDLRFLNQLQPQKPIFIVVTQSDLVAKSELNSILKTVKDSLDSKRIEIAGIMAWAAPIRTQEGSCIAGDHIHTWLNKIKLPSQQDKFEQLIQFIDALATDLGFKCKELNQSILAQQQLRKKLSLELSNELEKELIVQNQQLSLFNYHLSQLVLIKSSLYFDFAQTQLGQGKNQNAIDTITDAAILGLPKALGWLEDKKTNSTYVQLKLAGMYESGQGVKKNIDYAIDQYIEVLIAGEDSGLDDLNRLADQGYQYAIERLAHYYIEHKNNVLQAEKYHQILVKKYHHQQSLDWYYQQSLDLSSLIFKSFKNNLALRYNDFAIQFTYARILFAHAEIDAALEIMKKYVADKSVRQWLEKHEPSCPQISFQLANLYSIGLCYPKNIELALSKYKSLVEGDYFPALDALIQMAVENKYAEGFVCAARLYENKLQDIDHAIQYYVEAIRLKRADALAWLLEKSKKEVSQAVVSLRDLSRETSRQDVQSAYIEYLEKSAKVDDPAQVISLEAINFKNNKAYQWIKSYAEAGNEQARWYFIDFYQHKLVKSEEDRNLIAEYCYAFAFKGDEKAVSRLHPIAETHGGEPSYILGLIYSFGYATKKDLKEASYYFEKAHRDGVPYATYNFAAIPSQSNKKPYCLLQGVAHNILPAQKITSFPGNLFYLLGILRPKPVDFYLNRVKGLRINWLALFIYVAIFSGVGYTSYKYPEFVQKIKNSIVSLWLSDESQVEEIYVAENEAVDLLDIHNRAELIARFYPHSNNDIRVQGVYEYQNLHDETRYLIPVLSDYDEGKNVCNACQAPIDFFVFKKLDKGYQLVARNEANTLLTIGHGTDNSMIEQLSSKNVVSFGSNKQGLLLTSRHVGSGESLEVAFLILIDEQDGLIRNIADESMQIVDGEGYIGSEFTSKYHFDELSEHQGIYDFVIEQEGTALNENREVIPHHRKLTYQYVDYKFELVKDENLSINNIEKKPSENQSNISLDMSNSADKEKDIREHETPLIPDSERVEWLRTPRLIYTNNDLQGYSRRIVLDIEADEKGVIENISVVSTSGLEELDLKVIRSVRAARFKPFIENGNAVSIKAQQPFELTLNY